MGSPIPGQPCLTWAMIRWVTAARVCGSGVSGTLFMMAWTVRPRDGGNAGAGIAGDDPGCDATASWLAGGPAGRVRAAVHRPVIPYLLRPGLRVPGPDRQKDGVRDAGRRGPVAGLAARPGALVLLPRPVEP